MNKIISLLLIGWLSQIPLLLSGQCLTPADDCTIANKINMLPFSGVLSDDAMLNERVAGCNRDIFYQNPSWYEIEVSSAILEVRLTSSLCQENLGIHASLFASCTDSLPIAVQCDCSTAPFNLRAEGLTPGAYYLVVDGCNADVCNFEIELIEGTIVEDTTLVLIPFQDTVVCSQTDFCPGELAIFSVPENPLAREYLWSLPPGYALVAEDCNEIQVIIGSDPGQVELHLSDWVDTVQAVPFFVDITNYTDTVIGTYCFPDEPGWFDPWTNTLWPVGSWQVPWISARGCDSILFLEVIEIVSPITVLDVFICGGDTVFVGGIPIISPGNYNITIPSGGAQGCDSTVIVNAQGTPGLNLTFNIQEDFCGTCEGEVEAVITRGTPPFTFDWSNGASTTSQTNLCANLQLELLVTDGNGCTITDSIELAPSAGADLQVVAEWINPSCIGTCDGQISLTINCGTPPYTIDWDGNLPDGEVTVTGLCTGVYGVEVSDSAGDTIYQQITTDIPNALQVVGTIGDVSCNGGSSGSIDLSILGGNSPYSIGWSDGAMFEDRADLPAGTYDVSVVDALGCLVTASFTISEPTPLELEITSESVSCLGLGQATASGEGGTPPYGYDWSNGESGETVSGLDAGNYFLTLTDANGCTIEDSIAINNITQLLLSSTPTDCDSTGGTATVTLTGGGGNPTYTWSNGGSGATQTNLAPGGYSVTVTDGNTGCTVHRNIIVPLDTACFVRISGYVYNDNVDRDCIVDSTSVSLPNILIELDNGERTFTDPDGRYEFTVLPGNYELSMVLNTAAYDPLCGTTLNVNAPTLGQNYSDNNFYLKDSDIIDLELKVNKNNARPGFLQQLYICVMNPGAVAMDGTLTFVHDPIQEFSNTNIPQTEYDAANHTLRWDFTNHPPGVTIIYRVAMLTPIGTPLGQTLNMYFKVDPITNDLTPDNNELTCNMEVTGSYDPNDKQVQPEGLGDEGAITMEDSLLTYQIRFQNTGTDTAFTVVIRDTLDNNLDPSSVVPGPASHPYELTFLKGNILEFTFNNILLPDSFVNEPASNGFVFFDVQLKEGLDYGEMMKNTAAIYFDFNEPIITNTVTNTLRMPVSTFSPSAPTIELSVNPNPASEWAYLDFELQEAHTFSIEIYDRQGRYLRQLSPLTRWPIGQHRYKIDGGTLTPGLYLIVLKAREGIAGSYRMIIENN